MILFPTNASKETEKARQFARAGRTNPGGKQLGTPGLDRQESLSLRSLSKQLMKIK
jgi:hypothetical protein